MYSFGNVAAVVMRVDVAVPGKGAAQLRVGSRAAGHHPHEGVVGRMMPSSALWRAGKAWVAAQRSRLRLKAGNCWKPTTTSSPMTRPRFSIENVPASGLSGAPLPPRDQKSAHQRSQLWLSCRTDAGDAALLVLMRAFRQWRVQFLHRFKAIYAWEDPSVSKGRKIVK